MAYFIYQNPHLGRSRIHRADCAFCRNGVGSRPADTSWHWHSPFDRLELAVEQARQAIGEDVKVCGMCRP